MRPVFARLGVFAAGFPLSVALVVFLPHRHHLAANLVVSAMSMLAAVEWAAMLRKKNLRVSDAEALLAGLLPPLAVTAHVSFGLPAFAAGALVMALASWPLLSGVTRGAAAAGAAVERVTAFFAALVYPGGFLCWAVLINGLDVSPHLFAFYLCLVLITDSCAWLFGVLFGKSSRGVVAVSPNKSAAGYAGGFFGAALLSAGALRALPELFAASPLPPLAAALGIGLLTAFNVSAGDLVESALKRSAGVKDSGRLMPGRGGILDSVDSLAYAAPAFYAGIRLLCG